MSLTQDDGAAGETSPAAAAGGEAGWRARADRPIYRVRLWPNRSLPRRRVGLVLGIAAAGFVMPLAAAAATPAFWMLLPFCALPVGLLWLAFRRSYDDGRLSEELTIWRDELRIERREPRGRVLRWGAEPLRVRLRLYEDGRKVEQYLTLAAAGREIELGAFLAPEERVALAGEIEAALSRAIRPR